jgi:hypothetical protein
MKNEFSVKLTKQVVFGVQKSQKKVESTEIATYLPKSFAQIEFFSKLF